MITFELMREMTADTELRLPAGRHGPQDPDQNTGDNIGTTPTTNYLLQIDLPAARYTPRMAPNWQGQNRVQTLSGRGVAQQREHRADHGAVVNAISAVTA
jgi:hypothetical protein